MAANLITGNNSTLDTSLHEGVTDVITDVITEASTGQACMWRNGNLVTSRYVPKQAYEYTGFSSDLIQAITFTITTHDIAHDDSGNLIVVNGPNNEAHRYVGLSNTPDTSFTTSPLTYAAGAYWYGGNLYVSEFYGDVAKFQGFSDTLLDSVALASGLRGVAILDGNLITANSSAGLINVYVGFSNTLDYSFIAPGTNRYNVWGLGLVLDEFIPGAIWF